MFHSLEVLSLRRMGAIDWTAMILLIIGGLNWGIVGLFDMDLVAACSSQDHAVQSSVCSGRVSPYMISSAC